MWYCVWRGCTFILCQVFRWHLGQTVVLFHHYCGVCDGNIVLDMSLIVLSSLWHECYIRLFVFTLPHQYHYANLFESIGYIKWFTFCRLCFYNQSLTNVLNAIYRFCVFALLIFIVMIARICVLYRIFIIKSDVWIMSHCLGLGHKTVVWFSCLALSVLVT